MTVALFVALGTAYAQHDHGANDKKDGSKMNQSMHSGMKMESDQIVPYDAPNDFKDQLGKVYSTSLQLTEGFVAGENTSTIAKKVKSELGNVDMGLLKSSEAHMDWMMNLKVMNVALDEISESKDTKGQKAAYASFNEAFYRSIKAFGITGGPVYYQHCPMALDNKGAFWLSDSKDIRNPYLDMAMLTCGSNKEVIN